MRPDAIAIALPILLVHLVGLPTALLVSIRLLARIVQVPRWFASRHAQDNDDADDALPPLRTLPPAAPSALPKVKPRDTFGLRGLKS